VFSQKPKDPKYRYGGSYLISIEKTIVKSAKNHRLKSGSLIAVPKKCINFKAIQNLENSMQIFPLGMEFAKH
jgi:hypothetical protein